jgi:hypothetical protein
MQSGQSIVGVGERRGHQGSKRSVAIQGDVDGERLRRSRGVGESCGRHVWIVLRIGHRAGDVVQFQPPSIECRHAHTRALIGQHLQGQRAHVLAVLDAGSALQQRGVRRATPEELRQARGQFLRRDRQRMRHRRLPAVAAGAAVRRRAVRGRSAAAPSSRRGATPCLYAAIGAAQRPIRDRGGASDKQNWRQQQACASNRWPGHRDLHRPLCAPVRTDLTSDLCRPGRREF